MDEFNNFTVPDTSTDAGTNGVDETVSNTVPSPAAQPTAPATQPTAVYQAPAVSNSQYTYPPRSPYDVYRTDDYAYYHREQHAAAPTATYTVKEEPKKEKRSFSFVTLIVCILISAILSTAISSAVTASVTGTKGSGGSGSGQRTNTNTTITNNTDNFVEAVAEKVRPSVVSVVCSYTYSTFGFFGSDSNSADSEGSGVIYSADGYIITNKHVIEYAISRNAKVSVYLMGDKTKYDAQVVGYDSSIDLAVLKIDADGLPMAEIGDSDSLKIGNNAVAVGNPGGRSFAGSVSVGYISGLNREVVIDSTKMNLIQTDTAINPGNSGGALVDNEGKLIGITNAKLVSEDFEGMGFAIPINTATEVCDRLITGKNESKPYIGVSIDTNYTSEYLEEHDLPAGVVVASVVEGGPADKAGIKARDIIVSADSKKVRSYDQLVSVIKSHKIGDKMTVSVYRDGEYLNFTVTIGRN